MVLLVRKHGTLHDQCTEEKEQNEALTSEYFNIKRVETEITEAWEKR
jgi:hypothetical protein